MKKTVIVLACGLTIGSFSNLVNGQATVSPTPAPSAAPTAQAQPTLPNATIPADTEVESFQEAKERLQNMNPNQRKAFFGKMKDQWDLLSAADKDAFKSKMKMEVDRTKDRIQVQCEKLRNSDGESIYLRLYSLEQLENAQPR